MANDDAQFAPVTVTAHTDKNGNIKDTHTSIAPLRVIHNDDKGPVTFTETKRETSNTTRKVNGHNEHVNMESHTDTELSGDFDNRVMELINGVIQERENRENERANKRNLNRLLTLIGALVIGMIVTYVLQGSYLGHTGKELAPYSFTITIFMDSALAVYGFIKHY
jgi:hypothetical protein